MFDRGLIRVNEKRFEVNFEVIRIRNCIGYNIRGMIIYMCEGMNKGHRSPL